MFEREHTFRKYFISALLLMLVSGAAYSTSMPVFAAGAYTVTVSGLTYKAVSPSGSTLYSGTSASSAINKALSTVPSGGTVYINGGTYLISSQLVLRRSNVILTGDSSAVLKATSNVGYIFVCTGGSSSHLTGVKITNITFDGNLKSAGVSVKWVDGCVIQGVTIKNTAKRDLVNGLEIKGSSGSVVKGVTVTGCKISNIYASGVAMQYISDSKVLSNTFVDCAQYYPSGGAVLGDAGCQRITVQGNSISGRSDNDGIYMGTSRSFASGCVITGNTINLRLYGSGGGSQYAGSGIKVYTLNSEIGGNTINWNDAPYVYGVQNYGLGNNIHNNKIVDARVGIGCQKTYYNGKSTVTGNTITGCYKGLEILQTGCVVTGNTITTCTVPLQTVSSVTLSSNTIAKY
jgi:hypothetical protein